MNQHLKDSRTTYVEHAKWAAFAGVRLIWAGIASLLHAAHPALFPGTAARTVIDLYFKRLHDHPNPAYQDYINDLTNEDRKC